MAPARRPGRTPLGAQQDSPDESEKESLDLSLWDAGKLSLYGRLAEPVQAATPRKIGSHSFWTALGPARSCQHSCSRV